MKSPLNHLYKLVFHLFQPIGDTHDRPGMLQERSDHLNIIPTRSVPRQNGRAQLLNPKLALGRSGEFVAPVENLYTE